MMTYPFLAHVGSYVSISFTQTECGDKDARASSANKYRDQVSKQVSMADLWHLLSATACRNASHLCLQCTSLSRIGNPSYK